MSFSFLFRYERDAAKAEVCVVALSLEVLEMSAFKGGLWFCAVMEGAASTVPACDADVTPDVTLAGELSPIVCGSHMIRTRHKC